MKDSSFYILIAIPFFFAMMGLEGLIGYFRKKALYEMKDTVTNLSIGIGNQAIGLFFKVLLIGAYVAVYENFALFHIVNPWIAFLVGTVLFDFIFYWAHRL